MSTRLSLHVMRAEAARHRPRRAGRARDLFDAFVRNRTRHSQPEVGDIASIRALARAFAITRVPAIHAWVDLVKFREHLVGTLPASIVVSAVRGLVRAGEQLSREGVLPGRPRHRGTAQCLDCGHVKQIERVSGLLCAQCVGQRTLGERFVRLCARVQPEESIRRQIVDMLIQYESAHGIHRDSFSRVRHLSIALVRMAEVRPLRTWKDLEALRAGVKATLSPAMAHHARWGIFKLSRVLLERGVLPHRPKRTVGPMREQLDAVLTCFDGESPKKRALLSMLIDYYIATRVTITAVQVAWGFAYYLTNNPIPSTASWPALVDEGHRVMVAGGRWASRIQTALLRVGEALEARGDLPVRDTYLDVASVLQVLQGNDEVAAVNRRYVVEMRRRRRRPVTLHAWAVTLREFWRWARDRGVMHPAQITRQVVLQYLREYMPGPRAFAARQVWCTQMRAYFRWLRRERLVLHDPIPGRLATEPAIVRVTTRRAIEDLVTALTNGRLDPEDALLVYLVLFHSVRNFEAAQLRGLGYHRGVFHVAVPSDRDDRHPRPTTRLSSTLALPTDRYPWLRAIVDGVLERRATKLKHPNTPYLFVREMWRRGERPLTAHTIWYRVTNATEQAVGVRLTPVLLRDTGATLVVDAADHTVCLPLGWSPGRARDFGFGRREVVAVSVEKENSTFKKQKQQSPTTTSRTPQKRR